MGQVAAQGDRADRDLASVVLREHQAYVVASANLFLSVDHHDPVAVTNAIDGNTVDPVFGMMEGQVYTAAATHEKAARSAVSTEKRTSRIVLFLDIATLLAGIALLVGAGVVVSRYQRALALRERPEPASGAARPADQPPEPHPVPGPHGRCLARRGAFG